MLMDSLLFHSLLAAAVAIITGTTFLMSMRGVYQQESDQRGNTIVQFVAAQAQFSLLVHDWPELRRLAEKSVAIQDVLFVEIVDRNCQGIRLAASGFAESDIPPCSTEQWSSVRRIETPSRSRTIIEASYLVDAPDTNVLLGIGEERANVTSLGMVRIGLSVDRPKANAMIALRRTVVVWTFALIIILAFVFFQLRKELAPVHALATFAASIDEETLGRRARISGAAEIAALADSFNRMLDRLAATLVSRDLAEQASKAKGQFLANMGHELRTPLNAIIGYSEMAAEECQDRGWESLLPDLRKIRGAGKMLLDLMNDLLDYSKADAGRMKMGAQPVSVREIMQDVADTVEPMALSNHNRLVLESPADPLEVIGDPLRFRQSLLNLASNACKFTENGTVTLRACSVRRKGHNWCDISVQDTGIGIAPDQAGRLFEAFVQLEPSQTRKFGGTGLGLAISRKYCRLMGGDITLESIAGQGSTFTISLPAEPASHTTADSAETIRGA